MKSGVFIVPASYVNHANTFSESMGWGNVVYSVALSPSGSPPATHYGCRPDVTEGFLALLENPPEAAQSVLSVVDIDIRDSDDPFSHWSEVLADRGLEMVRDETF
jgi:hypothetical protein